MGSGNEIEQLKFQRFSSSVTSFSQSTLISFLKRSAPETHDANDSTSNDVHSKKKKREDNKKKYETKRIRKFQPAWQKEFDWAVYQEETNKMYCSTRRKYAELPKDMFFQFVEFC